MYYILNIGLLFDSLFLWQEGAPEAWAHVFSLIKFAFNEL